MNRLLAAVVALMLIGGILIVLSAVAQAANVERGRAYARSHCARCHAIDEKSASPLAIGDAGQRQSTVPLLVQYLPAHPSKGTLQSKR